MHTRKLTDLLRMVQLHGEEITSEQERPSGDALPSTRARTDTCAHACVHTPAHAHRHVHERKCTHPQTHVHPCVLACARASTFTHKI